MLRDGQTAILPAEEITVGDVVLLEAGDQIPADGRLIDCASLQTNESALTGESTNVEKSLDTITDEVPLADRKNMVYSGGFVTYGRGAYVVTEVGMQTEVGKIASLIQNAEARKTPLQITLDQFGKRLSIGIMIVCALVFVLSMIRVDVINFSAVMDSLMFAIALAVAAIPEALSSIVTIVLSFGTQKMSQEHAIMRKLQAVEGLGSVSVICSDKTGTLTQNKMTVRKIVVQDHIIAAEDVSPENPEEQELILASVLCSDATCQDGTEIGDPTETALVRFAQNCGLSDEKMRGEHARISEIPFDSDRKLMSTLNQHGDVRKMYTKGATDVLLNRMTCSDAEKQEIVEQVEELSKQGLRVLCFAAKPFSGTFSKILAPGLRVGYVSAPKEIIAKITVCKQVADVHTNIWAQAVCAEFLERTDMDTYLEKLRAVYRRKCNLMADGIRRHFSGKVQWEMPQGGLFLWCTLPDDCDMPAFCTKAVQEYSIAVVPGNAFLVDETAPTTSFRLNFSTPSDEQIVKGIEILGGMTKKILGA